jgi:3D (Asp-Asp-Asp) domain-containing protein/uncharacterized protein YabE (DUF348 family)
LAGRGRISLSQVLAVVALTGSFVGASFVVHPSSALASADAAIASGVKPDEAHTVTFESKGADAELTTTAATVGDFLREQNVTVAAGDYVDPAIGVPISDGLLITYRPAVELTIRTGRQSIAAVSSAADVGAMLVERHVALGPDDLVHPALSDPLPADGVVRIQRVTTWVRTRRETIVPKTIHRLDFSMDPGSSRTIAAGASGRRTIVIRFTRVDGGKLQKTIVASHVTRKPRTRVVADGIGEYDAFARFAARGIQRSQFIAQRAMEMVATAYTADCAGCSGMTAIGRRAGHGIVAVDPRVIPLGTRLFIPGYGLAVAGDTGGAIRGLRIDLGFNSTRDALLFGRREVTVYRLK